MYPRACFSKVLLTKSKAVLFSFKMGVPEENENYRPRREGRGITWFPGGTERGISRHNSNSDFCFYEVESHMFDFGFRSSICGYRFKIFPFRTSDLRFRTFQFGVLSSISDLRLRILEIWFRSCLWAIDVWFSDFRRWTSLIHQLLYEEFRLKSSIFFQVRLWSIIFKVH